jgi:hypothetical protein
MRKRRRWLAALVTLAIVAILLIVYVVTHPLVFLEAHRHCIKFAGLELARYADLHQGRFPFHPGGYGNALLLLDEECFHALTGPGYDAAPLVEAKKANGALSEVECGRVYVQGLTRKSNSEIAQLFDKLPTPGGDHCHLPMRLWAPLGREVWFVGGHSTFVAESDWPEFAKSQVDLLATEGFDRQEAERLFASKPK